MSHMLKKYETKSARVKGLAFHPHRPWILSSLHNGAIHLYNYRMEILLDSFEEHDGPVRGIDFHQTQPLFASGGDDYKVKVWNYQLRRCLFTLHGHLDYIRTVQFHPSDHPWLVSASDDQTIRIWNWQSRNCLVVLTGHNHYVMCAQWHPTRDLLLSASLDQTVRVWDISGLRRKATSVSTDKSSQNSDMFGSPDAMVKYVLEGHTRGVNWAAFHPTMNLVVSGADDREVKLWRMGDSDNHAWETHTYRGHTNNVSCVMFVPREGYVISNSEDKTLRIWDMARIEGPRVFRRDGERYWVLKAHPTLNLYAAGHDAGLVLFKLRRERPPFDPHGDTVFYFDSHAVRGYSLRTERHQTICTNQAVKKRVPRRLFYNQYSSGDHNLILFYDADESYYELYNVDKRGQTSRNTRSPCTSVAFVSRNRFAVLEAGGEVTLKNMSNEAKRTIKIPERSVNAIFLGGIGRLLLRSPDCMTLFDVSTRKTVRELQIQSRFPIKFVFWAPDFSKVALLGRFSIVICDADLNDLCTIYENAKLKSGVWDDTSSVFIYTTITHIKYALTSGDHGIIKTLNSTIYVTAVRDNRITCITRDTQIETLEIDNTEYVFKRALTERRYPEVKRLIEQGKLKGESIIAYLQKKGFPEVALRFVDDAATKFSLALECGDVEQACYAAKEIDTNECWDKLAQAALMQGNFQFVQLARLRTKNFEKLLFLFLITGNSQNMTKLLTYAQQMNDNMMRFHNSLFVGNIEERVKVLKDCGQKGFAYLTAKSHGLDELAESLRGELGDKEIILPGGSGLAEEMPLPQPLVNQDDPDDAYNWPRHEIKKSFFDLPARYQSNEAEEKDRRAQRESNAMAMLESDEDNDENPWDDSKRKDVDLDNQWQVDLDEFEMSGDDDEDDGQVGGGGGDDDFFMMPSAGKSTSREWIDRSNHPSDMVAAGAFDLAQESLHRQYGIINFAPLKPYFMSIYQSSFCSIPSVPSASSIMVGVRRVDDNHMPRIGIQLKHVRGVIQQGYELIGEKEFENAIDVFRQVLHMIPFVILSSSEELREIRQAVRVCGEYINAVRCKVAALEAKEKEDVKRHFELSCYFTEFREVQDTHRFLGLFDAIRSGYMAQLYQTTGVLCTKLLDLAASGDVKFDTAAKVAKKVQDVRKKCEKKGTDKFEVAYKPHDHHKICAMTLEPIARGEGSVRSPYCGSVFKPEFDGQVSPVCNLVRIGANAEGVSIAASEFR